MAQQPSCRKGEIHTYEEYPPYEDYPLNHMQMQTTVKGNDPRYKPVMKRKSFALLMILVCLACVIGIVMLIWKG